MLELFSRYWWTLALRGVLAVAFGAIALIWPAITALALLYLIAAWAIVTGVAEIAAAVLLRHELYGEWLLALGGVVSVLFGLYAAIWPGRGAVAVAWVIGLYAIVFGVALVALGLRLRQYQRRLGAIAADRGRPAPAA